MLTGSLIYDVVSYKITKNRQGRASALVIHDQLPNFSLYFSNHMFARTWIISSAAFIVTLSITSLMKIGST
jgi:UDP-N-acetylmuramyl pentapeptide phosphotransferase/UDP-N-acetylglucosamine-1-phosphate transferase